MTDRTKPSTKESPVARAIFRVVTYQWRSGPEIARAVLKDMGPNRHWGVSLDRVRAVLATLYRGGFLDKKLIEGVDHAGQRRKILYYRLVRRPEHDPGE